jgi:uncharacterized damage-inducible protein DinB
MTIAESILRDHEAEAAFSRALLAAVPEERFSWKPHEKSMSLGELAGHIAEAPSWVEAMGTESFDFAALGEEYAPFAPSSSPELLETLDSNTAAFRRFLADRDDDFMSAEWSMSAGEHEIVREPRDAAIRSILLHHVSHHRGQLTVYLRLLGVEVPRTYGPTADHPNAW